MLTVLLVRNAFLFSTPEYEWADMGADSILIEQARPFTLLVGNYSREGFNHPGPAFLYIQAWGKSVFWALLRVVPTPWNGQLIGLAAERGVRGVRGGGRLRLDQVGPGRAHGQHGGWPARLPAPGGVQLGLDAVRVRARPS